MAGTITPLPVMLEEEDRRAYEALEPPSSIVVRFGYQRMIAELPYDGDAKPGCGSKLVVRTHRGTEVGEMLTTTCDNAGCAKSVTRKQMLQYISNSGGKDYPFSKDGKVLRVATVDDLNEQAKLDRRRADHARLCKGFIAELDLDMHLVDVEVLLGGERVLFYYKSEHWVDFRELVRKLAAELQTRIEMVQVNDREEARIVADYEKCGQHCCCKQFLKVLKPVSMRSAKVQKATLDPQKISGRCGRLMCCLRYEDKTYSELKKNLPHRKSVVETEDGIGVVLDTQILTQLALVKIGMVPPAAYPVENIRVLDKEEAKAWQEEQRKQQEEMAAGRMPRRDRQKPQRGGDRTGGSGGGGGGSEQASSGDVAPPSAGYNKSNAGQEGQKRRRRKRKRRSGSGDGGSDSGQAPADSQKASDSDSSAGPAQQQDSSGYSNQARSGGGDGRGDGQKRKRRRRRRRKRGGGGGGGGGQGGGDS